MLFLQTAVHKLSFSVKEIGGALNLRADAMEYMIVQTTPMRPVAVSIYEVYT